MERVRGLLISEVDTYNKYLIGEVYGYQIFKGGDIEDSCYGFYDSPEDIITKCKSFIDTCDEQLELAF